LKHPWWQAGVIYQVYPRSFKDASGDGVGDLKGIAERLDYLEWLGVDAVWICPFYPSPMADFGYDVSDHTGVHPVFGALEDFDGLLQGAHERRIRVLLDFVPNHTSDEHPWFRESRSSRTSPKRHWYIWRDSAPDGGPPNNWISMLGGEPAWTFDGGTGQYYLRTFDAKQPDLNWWNPEVREAMHGVMRFWLDRGVDGFRIDVLSFLIKDEHLRDNPEHPDWRPGGPPYRRQLRLYSEDRPEVHEVVREMRAVADAYGHDKVLVGESALPPEKLVAYYGEALDGVHLPFNFGLVLVPEWTPRVLREMVEAYEAALPVGAWPNWFLGNHDGPRIAGRVGAAQARIAQMLLLTLRGTPTCYYGDEIGMQDVPIPEHLVVDPQGKRSPGHGRDPARTPMQWDAAPNAGFCREGVEPWLPVAADHPRVNVEAQRSDPRSMLALFRRLISLRRRFPALSVGSYRSVETGKEAVFAYLREDGSERGGDVAEQRLLVALNLGASPQRVHFSEASPTGVVLCSTELDREDHVALDGVELRPNEGVVVLCGDADPGGRE
jgi:alpha-glucosidase